jgi:hypothetical protein
MGLATSQPSNVDLGPQEIMDKLLVYMMKQLTIRDFTKLSDPAQCKHIIIFMANELDKAFYQLKVLPTRSATNTLSFRKVTELIAPTERKDIEHRQGLCLTLAYFYTRIFQIYGAIALTVREDAQYIVDRGITRSVTTNQRLFAPGHPEYVSSGGALPYDLGFYSVLQPYLQSQDDEYGTTRYTVNYTGTSDTKAKIYFIPGKKDDETGTQPGKFDIRYTTSSTIRYYLDTTFTKSESGKGTEIRKRYKFIPISLYRINPNGQKTVFGQDLMDTHRKTIIKDAQGNYIIEGDTKSISFHFNELFRRIILACKENDVDNVYVSSKDSYQAIQGMDFHKIRKNLEDVKPQGHCVARALQLLQQVQLGDGKFHSYICKTKFMESSKSYKRSGLPERGASIATSPGISALVELFHNTIEEATPALRMSASSRKQYEEFITIMARRFGKADDTPLLSYDLERITNKRDAKICGDTHDEITISSSTASSVKDTVNELFTMQAAHVTACMKIIHRLFTITQHPNKSVTISLSEELRNGGIITLNAIGDETRALLVRYYSNCESKYIEGVKKVLKGKESMQSSAPSVSTSLNFLTKLGQRQPTPIAPTAAATMTTVVTPAATPAATPSTPVTAAPTKVKPPSSAIKGNRITVHAIHYDKDKPATTDFAELMKMNPTTALFIYNENFIQYRSGSTDGGAAGNAQMRPYRQDISSPRIDGLSLGIPTGNIETDPVDDLQMMMLRIENTVQFAPVSNQSKLTITGIFRQSITNIYAYLRDHPTITDVYYSAAIDDTSDHPRLGIRTFLSKPWTIRNKTRIDAHFTQLIKQLLLLK